MTAARLRTLGVNVMHHHQHSRLPSRTNLGLELPSYTGTVAGTLVAVLLYVQCKDGSLLQGAYPTDMT